ncbi:MAG TPA: hypothetical protein VE688_06205 [Gaiellaceae bacterium]|nr:hypothetical protein [Gaiellaceae bacterium]
MSLVPDVEKELDRLYSLPLDEFTKERNELARRLAKAGQGDAAAEVKQLAKPSIPVWTVNQLARREPGEVRALLRSGEELRKAQQRALEGKGAADLQKRLDDQRRSVRALARLGREILADEGRSASDAIVERIGKTLDAAALDEASSSLLRAGRLTEELEPPGFEALAGMAPAGALRKERPAAGKRKSSGGAGARRRVADAKREARGLEREAVRAEREAERSEQAAAEARRAATEARERADEADRAVAEAEAALRAATDG